MPQMNSQCCARTGKPHIEEPQLFWIHIPRNSRLHPISDSVARPRVLDIREPIWRETEKRDSWVGQVRAKHQEARDIFGELLIASFSRICSFALCAPNEWREFRNRLEQNFYDLCHKFPSVFIPRLGECNFPLLYIHLADNKRFFNSLNATNGDWRNFAVGSLRGTGVGWIVGGVCENLQHAICGASDWQWRSFLSRWFVGNKSYLSSQRVNMLH